jgi:hypothetical protein
MLVGVADDAGELVGALLGLAQHPGVLPHQAMRGLEHGVHGFGEQIRRQGEEPNHFRHRAFGDAGAVANVGEGRRANMQDEQRQHHFGGVIPVRVLGRTSRHQ